MPTQEVNNVSEQTCTEKQRKCLSSWRDKSLSYCAFKQPSCTWNISILWSYSDWYC